MRTDWDYADMVNPYVRAEEEAHSRGFREGIGAGIFGTTLILAFVAALLLYSAEARSDGPTVWTFEQAHKPVKASARGAAITICQNNAVRLPWHCFSVL